MPEYILPKIECFCNTVKLMSTQKVSSAVQCSITEYSSNAKHIATQGKSKAHSIYEVPCPIQMRAGSKSNEELAAVGVGSCIGHRENAGPCVMQL